DNTNILTLIANFGVGKKIIITEHINYNFLQGFWRVLRRLTYPFADGLTVLTKYDYERYPYVKNRTIMPNPMFEIPLNLGVQKENLILSAGRLIPHKDFKTFLKALNLVDIELLKNWKIVIAGDGTERENLQNLAKSLNLNVDFVGFVSNLHDFYQKAKILVVTSTQEGFCNILMEGIYFDIARISTDCIAGPSELIESGKDGFLCEVGDEKGVAEKLEILMRDENLQEEFIKNANLRRNDFLAENICKKWVDFINLTLEKK
ncbi:MAG: glycosyltransferase, partial [Campylobacter sp.]|nr:glycosyltransferase [Campylobacter sp.]